MTAAHRLTRSIVLKVVSNVIVIALGLLTSVVLNKHLGKDSYGILIMIYTVTGFFIGFSDLGTRWVFNRFIPRYVKAGDTEECRRIVISGFIFQLAGIILFSAVLYFFSGVISAYIFHKNELAHLIRVSIFFVAGCSLVNLVIQVFQGLQAWKKESLINVLYPLFFILCIFGLFSAFQRVSVGGVILVNACASFAAFIIGMLLLPRSLLGRYSVTAAEFRDKAAQIVTFGMPLLLSQLYFYLNGWFDKILIGRYCLPSELTFYYIAFLFNNGLMILVKVIETVLMPHVAAAALPTRDELKNKFQFIFRGFIHIAGFVAIVSYFAIEPVIYLLYGKDYGFSVYIFRVSLAAFALRCATIGYGIFMINVFGRTAKHAFLVLSLTVANIIFNLLFIPRFGVIGGIYAEIFSYAVYWIFIVLNVDFVRELMPVWSVVRTGLATLIVAGVNVLCWLAGWRNIYAMCVFSILLYAALLKAFCEFKKNDIDFVRMILKLS
jgi:O-antigen/teichoic acid export membrane protein